MIDFRQDSLQQISNHFLVPEYILKKKNKNNTIIEFLQKRHKKYGIILKQARLGYTKIIQNYLSDGSHTITSIHDSNFVFYDDLLMKIIVKANYILQFSDNKNLFIKFRTNKIKNYYFLAKQTKKRFWIIGFSTEEGYIDSGFNCHVRKALFISKGIFAALKLSKKTEISHKSLNREYLNLKKVNKNKKIIGIQQKAFLFGIINEQNFESFLLNPLYNHSSLFNFLESDILKKDIFKIKFDLCLQLIQGLEYLHQNDIIHGDIKLENCFVHEKKGKFTIVIADFGEILLSKNIQKAYESENLAGTSVSLGYYTRLDHIQLRFSKYKSPKLWHSINKSRDVFALSMVIWYLFTGSFPFTPNKEGYPQITKNLHRSKEITTIKEFPRRFYQILVKALTNPPLERPSIHTIMKILNTQEDNPNAH